jgi:hypothetical protein
VLCVFLVLLSIFLLISSFLCFRRINHYELLPEYASEAPTPSSPLPPNNNANSNKEAKPCCSLCGFQFTMFKRQHHCRLCNCICCDDCSKKRAIIDAKEVQKFHFLLALRFTDLIFIFFYLLLGESLRLLFQSSPFRI